MATVRVYSTLGDLIADLGASAALIRKDSKRIVRTNVREGNLQAQAFAKRAAGPHGKNYWKRISSEMTGPLEGEFGPHGDVVENAVGAGWRNGPVNTDLARTADVIGRQFAGDVDDMLDRAFWP